MKVAEIRSQFLKYFAERGHTVVDSSSLVPANDPTLLFVNSGMVQFKDVFLGQDKRPYTRATSSQRSVRAGGKHNDLENVGYTARHHTFFEMLGNFSFGDYFKRDALKYAWELLTEVYKLPKERLWATVYAEDDEAFNIWTQEIGIPAERVVRIGDNKGRRYASDNFWQMADTGPCGPCSEIFYDHGPDVAGGPPGSPDEDGDRYIEIWNNVFMQFEMHADGSLTPLPKPCVDTGMGLERLAAILQGVHSNYELDLFQALCAAAARETGRTDLENPSLRVIADHIRACSFLIADGVIPGNDGRGYVLRRITRRALRHGHKLGQTKPFFYKLVAELVAQMGDAYPYLAQDAARVAAVIKAEEERFGETLENGMRILEAELAGGAKTLAGKVAFTLYDTYGFPLDLTADVCRERGVSVDEAGFTQSMEAQRKQAREAGRFKMEQGLDYQGVHTAFKGYEQLETTARVTALYRGGASVTSLKAGDSGVVVLDQTPFYAESGGQIGDAGVLLGTAARFSVEDTTKIKADVFGHYGQLTQGGLSVGDELKAQVDALRRARIVRNHSATHLMHKALREVLGGHVQQKGSEVSAERTRFDFAHTAAMTDDEIGRVEALVNAEILANSSTQARVLNIEDAKKTGATMLFGEKYGDSVRVLDIGSSREFCGGTHVERTGDIGLFKITGQSNVAAGIRRVEATTGFGVLELLQRQDAELGAISAALRTPASDALLKLTALQDKLHSLERELGAAKAKLASSQGDGLAAAAVDLGGVKFLAAELKGADVKALRETIDKLRDKLKSAVVLLACTEGGKVQLAAGVSADLVSRVKAGELVSVAAVVVGGKGGGRPDFAMAGGTDAAKLEAAFEAARSHAAVKLGA